MRSKSEKYALRGHRRGVAPHVLLTSHSLLLTPYSSLLTPHSLLLTPYSSLLTPHSLLLTPYSSLLTPHSLLLTPHSLLLTPYSSLFTPHSLLLTSHSLRLLLFAPLRLPRWHCSHRILRPIVPRISSPHILPHVEVAGPPEAGEISRDLHRPVGGREQLQGHRNAPARHSRGLLQSEDFLHRTASTGVGGAARRPESANRWVPRCESAPRSSSARRSSQSSRCTAHPPSRRGRDRCGA